MKKLVFYFIFLFLSSNLLFAKDYILPIKYHNFRCEIGTTQILKISCKLNFMDCKLKVKQNIDKDSLLVDTTSYINVHHGCQRRCMGEYRKSHNLGFIINHKDSNNILMIYARVHDAKFYYKHESEVTPENIFPAILSVNSISTDINKQWNYANLTPTDINKQWNEENYYKELNNVKKGICTGIILKHVDWN